MGYTSLFELPHVFPALLIPLAPRNNISAQCLIPVVNCGNRCVGEGWERFRIHLVSSGGKGLDLSIRQSLRYELSLLESFYV